MMLMSQLNLSFAYQLKLSIAISPLSYLDCLDEIRQCNSALIIYSILVNTQDLILVPTYISDFDEIAANEIFYKIKKRQ